LTVVVDASIAIKWLVAEPGHELAAALLLNFPATSAPDFVLVEVGNVLWKKVRRAEMSIDQAEQALPSLPRFFDVLFPARRFVGRALQISLELDHPIYDCLYLACAEENSAKLATVDARLMNKCANTPFAERILFVDHAIDPASLS
jgi:predicted nucleic acid-binding protein